MSAALRVANVRLTGRDKIDYAHAERDAIVKIFTEYVHEIVSVNRGLLRYIALEDRQKYSGVT